MKASIGKVLYIIALLFTMLALFLQLLPLSTLTHFESTLHISSTSFVYLVSLFFVTYSLMQLPGGILLDKYGVKYVLPSAIFITFVGSFLYWHSGSIFMLATSRLITGFGCSIAYISGVYIATKFFRYNVLPILVGILETTSALGSMSATHPLKFALSTFGWTVTGNIIFVYTFLLFCGALFLVRYLPEREIQASTRLNEIAKNALLLVVNRSLLLVFFYSLCTWLIIMSFAGYWLEEYLQKVHHFESNKALNYVNCYWISFLVSSLLTGSLVRNFKTAKFSLFILAGIGFLDYLIMSIPYVFNDVGTLLVIVFGGISTSGVVIAFSLAPYLVNPALCASAIALNNTFVVLGAYVGQVVFGIVLNNYDITDYTQIVTDRELLPVTNYYSALLTYLLFSALAFVAAIFILRLKIKPEKVISNEATGNSQLTDMIT